MRATDYCRGHVHIGESPRSELSDEVLGTHSVEVDHVTLFRWVQRCTPLLVEAARPCRHSVGGHWFVDKTYVKVSGSWRYVYRAVDQYGQVIDVFLSKKRDLKAATTFFTDAIGTHGEPAEVTTDRAHALIRVIAELLPAALHDTTPIRQQPGRSRPRAPQGQAPAHAGPQTGPNGHHRHQRSRLHPEPAARPLRTWCRCTSQTDPCRSVRRACAGGLSNNLTEAGQLAPDNQSMQQSR